MRRRIRCVCIADYLQVAAWLPVIMLFIICHIKWKFTSLLSGHNCQQPFLAISFISLLIHLQKLLLQTCAIHHSNIINWENKCSWRLNLTLPKVHLPYSVQGSWCLPDAIAFGQTDKIRANAHPIHITKLQILPISSPSNTKLYRVDNLTGGKTLYIYMYDDIKDSW